ncbi:MAG: SPOR domain-containing protein [Prevotellaceae bacterium]|jgi:hypothetical protein|nr:SPOR domain-containing protein [Prevotellaceae bacterium]
MYNRFFLILLLITSLSINSCDRVRSFFGLPTSKEITALKEKKLQDSLYRAEYEKEEEMRRQMDCDDLLGEVGVADSGVVTPQPTQIATPTASTSPVNTYVGTSNNHRFHIIVGSFKESGNAQKMMNRLSDNGYSPTQFIFKNGYFVVSAASFPTISEANALERQMKSNSTLFPYDSWVYDTSKGLHRDH